MIWSLSVLALTPQSFSLLVLATRLSRPLDRLCGRQTTLVHGPGATLKGVDGLGNKYYERMTESYGKSWTYINCIHNASIFSLTHEHQFLP